jgi:hypothetical protein
VPTTVIGGGWLDHLVGSCRIVPNDAAKSCAGRGWWRGVLFRSGGHGMKNVDLSVLPAAMVDLLREFARDLRRARAEEIAWLHNVVYGLEILRDGAIALRDEVQAKTARLRALEAAAEIEGEGDGHVLH